MTELLTLMKLVVLIFDLYSAVGSYSSKLYPFGNDAGDENLPDKDDENSPRISTPPLPFFGTNFTALYVNENGLISFGTTSKDIPSAAFPLSDEVYAAAPYWADVFTQRGGGVWYRKASDNVTVARVTRDIQRAFPHYTGFKASWAVIATWNEVAFYSAIGINLKKRNTFQVLIASNGYMTFVGYLYDKLSWTTGSLNGGDQRGLGGDPAKVGFSYGRSYHKTDVSGTDDVLKLVHTTNCGQPGVWFFRVDDAKTIDEKICESKGVVSFYPAGGSIHSGTNILITGLCYRPESELICNFGEDGTVKGNKFDDTKAVCSAPLITTRKQVEFSVYPREDEKLNFARIFNLEPIHFYNTSVELSGKPATWTSGNRVNILWNPTELDDLPVTVEIINLVDCEGVIQVHSNVTVVREKPNTGDAEFNLPVVDNMTSSGCLFIPVSNDEKEQEKFQMIRVRNILTKGYTKYVAKQWIWSGLFVLTNHLLAHNRCSEWITVQSDKLSRREGYKALTLCPKTRRQVKADVGRFVACDLCDIHSMPLCEFYYPRVDNCYLTRTLRNRGLARKCCYDSKGEFTPGPPSVITNQTKYPDKGASVFSLFREKIVPYMKCCMFSDNCFKYQELGIPEKDSGYMPPTIGASFGDPHIITFDDVEYTFNGFGEYTVLNVNNAQFVLQGRMQPLNGRQSGKSPATVFTAFAMRQKGGSLIQVHREDTHAVIVLINGIRRIIDFGDELQSTGVFITNTSRENYPRVVLAFTSGITIYIENAAVLQMAVTVPVEFKGKTSGLLGYWNDNIDEEYRLPNTEFLSTTSTMAQIHHHFGQQWATKVSDSLFTYGPGEKHADYFDTSYVPAFMEGYHPIITKMDHDVRKRALLTCDQSFQCVFDIAVTGRVDIGQATKEFQEWLLDVKRDLHDEGCLATLSLEKGSVRKTVAGDIITYHFRCDKNYIMVGKDKISCRGGIWDGSKPGCYRAASVECKSLDISIPNGNFSGRGNKLGDRYKFECNEPFMLVGEDEIICDKNGSWSGEVPFCQRRKSRTASSSLRSQTNVTPVVVIGVVVAIIAIIVAVVTICLVRKHRRRKGATEAPKAETPGDQEEPVAV